MTRTIKSLVLAATIAIFSGAFVASAHAAGTSAEDAIAAAKAAQKQARSVGGEWRDIGKMIKKAKKLLKAGKTEAAVKLAEEAEAQAILGYIQATSQPKDKLHI